ncbi:GNAT family N-acetyltransferase [Paenibacillus filicis]|uniref:GNAT family N-acetyltransferase n=1 Tax=Paenibacillus filicis TaxID=669464 RepID=A0ABU9DKZ9_9BACL
MSITYRLAVAQDAEHILRVIKGAYTSIERLGIAFRAVHADLDMVLDNIIQQSCYVLVQDGTILATLSLRSNSEVTPHPFLYWFAVDPAWGGKGIGSLLLTYVEETVVRDELKASAVTLATSRKHPWLLPMYERRGYERFFERALGTDDQLIFLTKPLPPVQAESRQRETEESLSGSNHH